MKPTWRYYIDFVTFPAVAMWLGWLDREHLSASWWSFALCGVVLFTFLEYWVHRVVLHRLMWHSTHQRHHEKPAEYVHFPIWYVPGIFALVYFVMLGAVPYQPTALFIGFMVGGMWFFGWHHAIHHWTQKPGFIKRYERWHDLHHCDLPVNYGITHPLWDMVFGTYVSYQEGVMRIREQRWREDHGYQDQTVA